MDTGRLRRIYEANGLMDGRLLSHQDLLKCHGIIANDVIGYARLTDENKALYQEFIINLYNGYGLEARNKIVPINIYHAKEINYCVLDEIVDGNEVYRDIVKEIYLIDKFGNEELVSIREIDKNFDNIEVIKEDPKHYLRFEFEYDGDDSYWLHVISPDEYY